MANTGPVSGRLLEITGHDLGAIRPALRVDPGDQVKRGDVLFVDRRRPQIAFVASEAGIVQSIDIGSRRMLERIVIRIEGEADRQFEPLPRETSAEALRALLLASGLWTRLRVRPYGRIPNPDVHPSAIFVTATRSDSRLPDPAALILRQRSAFARGLALIAKLTGGPVHLCHEPGAEFGAFANGRVLLSAFRPGRPDGLPGAHIAKLATVGEDRSVLQIGHADVIDLANLAETGRLPKAAEGDVVPVHEDGPKSALDRFRHWIAAAKGGAIVPCEAFDRAVPSGILAVPLMRALVVGDIETVRALGGLGLVEDDVADLSRLCVSGADYGKLLRAALDALEREAR
jgi:Na+-transporting NADH:ubiquinone oxidoreductase subunit A